MDANLQKNLPAPEPLKTVDEFNSIKILITKLNHDCLAHVLSYVPASERLEMEKVCQKWKEATEFSWYISKKLDLNKLIIPLDKREEILEKTMTRCCRYLTHLKIIDDQHPWMCNLLKNNCQKITHFHIDKGHVDGYKIPNNDFIEIIESMTKLKFLEVKMHHLDPSNLCNEILEQLPSDIKGIHLVGSNLNTYEMRGITASVINKFNCLQSLTLRGFPLTNETLSSLLSSKNTLVKLDLSDCKFPLNAQPILSNLNNLEHLNLYWVENLNVKDILSIGRSCPKLTHFEINFWDRRHHQRKIPYEFFHELGRLNLEHLKLHWFYEFIPEENQILNFPSSWNGLKDFNLHSNLTFNIEEIPKLKNLEYLDLSGFEMDSKTFIKIASNCLELKELIINFQHLPESALEKLENLKKLKFLDLNNCDNLTGNVLSKIVSSCKDLVNLEIYGCCNLTDASLIQLGELEHLTGLGIDYIDHLPNAMFYNFYKLEYLSCTGCPSVTDNAIIKVIDNCPNLYELHLSATGVTDKSLVHASKRKFVFKKLVIHVESSVERKYRKKKLASSPYLQIEVEEY